MARPEPLNPKKDRNEFLGPGDPETDRRLRSVEKVAQDVRDGKVAPGATTNPDGTTTYPPDPHQHSEYQPAGDYQPAGNYQPAGDYAAGTHAHDYVPTWKVPSYIDRWLPERRFSDVITVSTPVGIATLEEHVDVLTAMTYGTDDTPAIMAKVNDAAASGKIVTLFFYPGTYYLSPMNLPENVRLVMAIPNSDTVLESLANGATESFNPTVPMIKMVEGKIANLTLHARGAVTCVHGVRTVERCVLKRFTGPAVEASTEVKDCVFLAENSAGTGVRIIPPVVAVSFAPPPRVTGNVIMTYQATGLDVAILLDVGYSFVTGNDCKGSKIADPSATSFVQMNRAVVV